METQEILSRLIEDAKAVYSDGRLCKDRALRAKVAEAEEELLSALFALNHSDGFQDRSAQLPQIIEETARLEAGKPFQTKDRKIQSESIRNYLAMQRMEESASREDAYPVPNGLLGYVERSLDFDEAEKQKERTPGFAVTLLKEGLSVIKSSLQGFQLEPALATSIRRDSNARSMLRLDYQSKLGNIKIELLNEGNQRLGVRFLFPEFLSGQAVLKRVEGKSFQDSRILDSYTLTEEKEMAFHGLEIGTYLAEFPALDCRLPFLVQ